MPRDQDNVPVPDPSLLTTERLKESEATQLVITELELQIAEERRKALADLTTVRFGAVDQKFVANDVALQAALAAQKEAASEQNKSNTLAINKSEQTQIKLIENQAVQLSDLKERVLRLEAVKVGGTQAYAGILALAGLVILTAGVVIAAIALSAK